MRICIIDDNAFLQDALTLVLSDAGHEILFAENGSAGIELAASQKLDAAVIDYQLPDMNGDIVAAAIRAAQPDLPIVLVSGGFLTSLDTGDSGTMIDLFLQKPFTPKALLTAVTEARERRNLWA